MELGTSFNLIIFVIISCAFSLVLGIAPFFLAKRSPTKQKESTYECGFDPVKLPASKFNVKFYLVAILFIIFDLEIAFIFPWAVAFPSISDLGFFSMISFIVVLSIGFIYEFGKGALNWE